MIKEEAERLVLCGIPYILSLQGNDATKSKMGSKPFLDLSGEFAEHLAKEFGPALNKYGDIGICGQCLTLT